MKKSFIFVLGLLVTANSLAGDAGYFSRTCVSGSQRTVLTQLADYTNNADIYTLIIDGVPAVYKLNDPSVRVEGDDGYLTFYKDGKKVFSVQTPESTITVYQDPREGTIAMHDADPTPITIGVTCKDFWPNP